MTPRAENPAINERVCSRCAGSGQYSFNYMDGTRCYGCGGTGVQYCKPKGEPKGVKVTADKDTAVVGDIIELHKALHKVTRIEWRTPAIIGGYPYGEPVNQRVKTTRLADGLAMRVDRNVANCATISGKHGLDIRFAPGAPDWFRQVGALAANPVIVDGIPTGDWYTRVHAEVDVTEAMVGQEVKRVEREVVIDGIDGIGDTVEATLVEWS